MFSHHSFIPAALAFAVLCAACPFTRSAAAADAPPADQVVFSNPARIRYDAHSLIIDGQPIFLYSGAMHYFRCPRELWKDRLQKLKDAGLNCVETYLAWNYHEPTQPANPDDYSKLQNMQDISDFIHTARDLGLYVIIRPGPYICAEWDRGGLPGWLLKQKPPGMPLGHYLRADSPDMLAWDRHWITAAAKAVAPQLVTNLPPGAPGVILWQLENEYSYENGRLPAKVRTDVLRTLGQTAIANGITVPLFTCYTEDPAYRADPFLRTHVYDTTNSYPGFNMNSLIDGITKTADYQPEKFRGMSELQGGWFAQVGGKLSDQQGHNAAQINQLTLVAIEQGVTSMNYYMFYGGSNFGYGAGKDLIQSYDYNAPLREPGGIGDRYLAVKAIAQMLKEHGNALTRAVAVPLAVKNDTQKDIVVALRRAEDGSQFYFIRTPQQKEPRTGSVTVQPKDNSGPAITIAYDLPAFGAKVLYFPAGITNPAQGEWLPKPVAGPEHPDTLPAAIPLTPAVARSDSPTDWVDLPQGGMLTSVDVFNQRFVTYRASFNLTDADLKTPLALRVRSNGDAGTLTARINGHEVQAADNHGRTDLLPLDNVAHAGSNTADILFENRGAANFGPDIEVEQGIAAVSVIPTNAARQDPITDWRMKIISGSTNNRPEVAADFDDRDWPKTSVDGASNIQTPHTNAVFRGTLTVTKDQLAVGVPLTFGTIDDRGALYVNGQPAGASDNWNHPWTFDITPKLHEGQNSIAVVVRNADNTGGLYGGCSIDPVGTPIEHLQVARSSTGLDAHWENAPLASEGWQPAADRPAPSKLLSWYRMDFTMPAPEPHAWIPWKLHLTAAADAFLYFNGHLLGRYWAVGPQRDFWLPDCWLHQGDGQKNTIALQAHPTAAGPVIQSAEVRPYAEYAEKR